MKSKNSLSVAGILSAVFVAILPFVDFHNFFYGSVTAKYFYIITFVTVLTLYFAYLIFTKKYSISIKQRWLLLALGIVLLTQYISAFTGVYLARSLWSDIIRSSGVFFLTYVVLFAFLESELLNLRDWHLMRRAIAISGALFAFLTFLGVEGVGLTGRILSIDLGLQGLTQQNTTFAGAYLLIVLIITLIEAVRSKTKSKTRKLFLILAIVQFLSPLFFNSGILLGKIGISEIFNNPALILGSARASSATAILVVLYLIGYFIFKRLPRASQIFKSKLAKIWSALWILGVTVVVILLFVPGSSIQNKYIEQSSSARLIVWQSGITAFKDRPLFGWGPENFRFGFEKYFDSRLFLSENQGEIWFDRAHNTIVDNLVSVGVIGSSAIIFLFVWFFVVISRATKRGLIKITEANLLGLFVFGHFLQLQTSFDTVLTYFLAAFIIGYGLWLEKEMIIENTAIPRQTNRWIAIIILVLVLVGARYLLIGEYIREKSLVSIFTAENTEKQINLINQALHRESDFETIRLASASFVKGWLEQIGASDQKTAQSVIVAGLSQLDLYESYLNKYSQNNPMDYRASMNHAYLLLLKTVFEDNPIKDAETVIQNSYVLSPSHPLTYAMDSIALLYSGKIKASKAKINEVLTLNPNNQFIKNIKSYIETEEKEFPIITIVKLENL